MSIFKDFSTPQPVSTPTILLAFCPVKSPSILFCVCNHDPDNTLYMVVETAENPLYPDAEQIVKAVPPLQSGTVELGPAQTRSCFRLSAHTAEPEHPVVLVTWRVLVGR